MPTPFPGMDPYLEGPSWPDFHATFIGCWRDAILDVLPTSYDARIDERLSVVELTRTEPEKTFLPDVAVTRGNRESKLSRDVSTRGAATLEPVTLRFPESEEVRERRIEIRRRPNRELVAVLELLSPTNKEGAGQLEYLTKRNVLLQQPVHLIELDLLLGGKRLPMVPGLPAGDYFALIARAQRRPTCDVYAWTVRDRFPKIPVPLHFPEEELMVDLGEVFANAWSRGRYERIVEYDRPLTVSITAEQRAWIEEQAAQGDRPMHEG